ncbi:MAG: hypothetical protein M3439_10435 [Chloroflexota bacterium]|nr:hypothetical protein [Chloroflexota bacterium]
MNATVFRRLRAASLSCVLLIALATVASAHEHREVGEYELTVGFAVEPALVNEPNGLSLAVQIGTEEDGPPVEGLQETLEAEITYAGETMPLELRASFGQPGSYTADVFPTAEGTYTFRIFGTIEGTEIDESFTGGPDTFSEVESTSAIAFPATDASTDGEETTTSEANEAQDTADSAQTLAIIGIIAGILGLAAGIAGAMMAMNARSVRATTEPVAPDAGD